MSTLPERPQAVRAWHDAGQIVIELATGRTVRFPVAANDRLRQATPRQLGHIEISPYGLHWPDVDEDLSLCGILEGRYGRPASPSARGSRKNGRQARLQLRVSLATRQRLQTLAKRSGKSISALVEERFA